MNVSSSSLPSPSFGIDIMVADKSLGSFGSYTTSRASLLLLFLRERERGEVGKRGRQSEREAQSHDPGIMT